ncbi:hypothetical protein [Actinomadura sp. 3N508]|uniref:hypothetical protein n=1 Tax=Actinomadura sp. 3N508 TaxID=3375153 RepID=UPI0037AD61D0
MVAVVAGLALVGIVLRLIGGILSPVLPPEFMQGFRSGWHLLYSTAGPAIPAAMAIAILLAILFVVIGRR